MKLETTIYRERFVCNQDVDDEIKIEVEYNYFKGSKGYRNKYGVPEEPDDEPYIEIVSVTDKTSGDEIELTNKETDKVEEEIWKELSE